MRGGVEVGAPATQVTNVVPADYIGIYDVEGLNNIRNNLTGKYILMADIDLSGVDWESIGDSTNSFSGIFDGNGHTISNLSGTNGLFGQVKSVSATEQVEIKNINIKNANITDLSEENGSHIGIICGYANGSIVISDCSVNGTINAPNKNRIGGIAGQIGSLTETSTIINCSVDITIESGKDYLGGIAGFVTNTTIQNCKAKTIIKSANDNVGGIVGSTSTADITINDCSANINIKSAHDRVGGAIGLSHRKINLENVIVTGSIVANLSNGGLVGYYLDYSLATNITSTITKCYSDVSITSNATQSKGGLIGFLKLNGYSNTNSLIITDSYWNKDTAGLNNSIGQIESSINLTDDSVGVTTAQVSTAGFFDIFNLDESIWNTQKVPPRLLIDNFIEEGIEYAGTIFVQVGANADTDINSIQFKTAVNFDLSVNLSTIEGCTKAIEDIDNILYLIQNKISELGAVSNRLESIQSVQEATALNYTKSRSTILDADIAEEVANFVKYQILQQSSSSLLMQASKVHYDLTMQLIK